MIDGRLIPGIVGALIGFAGAFFLSVVGRWRDVEKSKGEQRVLLDVLIAELRDRLRILNHRYADWDSDSAETYGSIVKEMNRGRSGITFDFENELRPYIGAFSLVRDRLTSFPPDIAAAVLRHYAAMEENLSTHRRLLDPPHNDAASAEKKLVEIREQTQSLIDVLENEKGRKQRRSFVMWLLGWIVGKS